MGPSLVVDSVIITLSVIALTIVVYFFRNVDLFFDHYRLSMNCQIGRLIAVGPSHFMDLYLFLVASKYDIILVFPSLRYEVLLSSHSLRYLFYLF